MSSCLLGCSIILIHIHTMKVLLLVCCDRSMSCVIFCFVLFILNGSLPCLGLQAAQKRVRQILRDSGGCKFSCAAFGLALVLVLLIVLLFKLL